MGFRERCVLFRLIRLPSAALAVLAMAAVACGSSDAINSSASTPTATRGVPTSTPIQSPEPELSGRFDTEAFEELNPRPELRAVDRSIDFGFDEHEAIPRDAIEPVYTPKFATPDEVTDLMIENELVMGLNIDGDVRAYPVGIMRFREMVNDEVGGIPLLVTW